MDIMQWVLIVVAVLLLYLLTQENDGILQVVLGIFLTIIIIALATMFGVL